MILDKTVEAVGKEIYFKTVAELARDHNVSETIITNIIDSTGDFEPNNNEAKLISQQIEDAIKLLKNNRYCISKTY